MHALFMVYSSGLFLLNYVTAYFLYRFRADWILTICGLAIIYPAPCAVVAFFRAVFNPSTDFLKSLFFIFVSTLGIWLFFLSGLLRADFPLRRMFEPKFIRLCLLSLCIVPLDRIGRCMMFLRGRGRGYVRSASAQARWVKLSELSKECKYADLESCEWIVEEYKFYYRDHVELIDGRNRRRR